MPTVLTPEQQKARNKARQLAQSAGKNWKDLSQEERREFLRQGRRSVSSDAKTATSAQDRAREAARAAATKDGRNWRELTREERQSYLAKARAK